jgi:hypothetical protein
VIVFAASIIAIVALLSASGINPAAWTLAGALLGAVGTFWLTKRLDQQRRINEARDISVSLHAEIADRAARCLNDYLVPWSNVADIQKRLARGHASSWMAKFRPVEPVVYPSIAAKLGLLPPAALFPVVQFYFRLDALRREIENATAALDHEGFLTSDDKGRFVTVLNRLGATLRPALLALEGLDVENAIQIENEAAETYPHVRNTDETLRDALRKHRRSSAV